MSDEVTLVPAALERIAALNAADIAIGIATCNNADTIGDVAEAARAALRDPLASYHGVIINADGGSTDDTVERIATKDATDVPVLQLVYPVLPGQKLTAPGHEIPDRGTAVRTILRAAQRLQAKVCVFLAPNLRGVSPASVAALSRPVLEDKFDFVAPYYTRHRFDGLVTSGLVYPLIRTLYGKRIRQPMGGDFAVSAAFAAHCLSPNVWGAEKGRTGVDLWLVTEAINRGFKLGQARVGAMSRVFRDSSPDLSATLVQVLTEIFDLTLRDVAIWQRLRGSEAVPVLEAAQDVPLAAVTLEPQRLIEMFALGHKNLQPVWSAVLPPASMLVLKRMAAGQNGKFAFPDQTWVRTVFDFALGYRLRIMNRDHLLRAFTPLYLAWVASFAAEMQDARAEEAERRIEALCLAFESEKPYLISRWRWPDRFNP
jgi:glucosylglycerate synthase